MNFTGLVSLGGMSYPPWGTEINGATSNTGTPKKVNAGNSKKADWRNVYESGIAKFGEGDDAIYWHYAPRRFSYVGDEDENKSIEVKDGLYGTSISQIKNDSNNKFYLLYNTEAIASASSYVCLGKTADGKWVKYFDTREITERYFGSPKGWSNVPWYREAHCDGDTVVIKYERGKTEEGSIRRGELRFKWDDAAQWFSVEHVQF